MNKNEALSLVALILGIVFVALALTAAYTMSFRSHCNTTGGTFHVAGPDMTCTY